MSSFLFACGFSMKSQPENEWHAIYQDHFAAKCPDQMLGFPLISLLPCFTRVERIKQCIISLRVMLRTSHANLSIDEGGVNWLQS